MDEAKMLSTPTTSKRGHGEILKSPVGTSPSRKKVRPDIKTAIGIPTFRDLVEQSSVFIDKTLLIKEFVQYPAHVLLITYPRRWCKSINMDMIKTFLEIEVDINGNRCSDKTKTSNYKLFQGNSSAGELEEPLNIAQDEEFKDKYDQFQGEYPAIFVDFKSVKGNSYQEIANQVKFELMNAFDEHQYMQNVLHKISNNSELTYSERQTAKDNLDKFERFYLNDGQTATEIDIQSGLKFLSEILHSHFGKKVYILMDEYDTPINNALENEKLTNNDLESTLTLLSGIMGTAFKGNQYLQKGLITGILRVSKAYSLSDLNNLVEFNILGNDFAKYYGFTESDLRYLFDEYEIPEKYQNEADSWYDGYLVGDEISKDQLLKIYNPWSIVQFLKNMKIANYWEESGNINFIIELFKIDSIKKKFETLIKQEPILLELENLKINKNDFIALKELLTKGDDCNVTNQHVDLFFRFIFAAGYLTLAEKPTNQSKQLVRLPNIEIRVVIEKKLASHYEKREILS